MPAKTADSGPKKSAGTQRDTARAGSRQAGPLSSEGHRLLLAAGASLRTIARAAGVGKTSVERWSRGECSPDSDARRNLKRAYGIPIEAWDCESKAPDPASEGESVESAAPPISSAVPSSSAAHFLELMHEVRRTRTTHKLAPLEKLRAIEREGALRTQYERALGGDRALEALIVRDHPAWLRFEETLIRALKPFPDALRAVGDALEKLHGGDR